MGQLFSRRLKTAGVASRNSKERGFGRKEKLGRNDELNRVAWKITFLNLIQGFGFQIKDFKHFQTNFELKPN
jgi:hypothetical protein